MALDRFEVEGIGHNLPFLSAVMGHERFQSGNITTAFIAEEYPEGFEGVAPTDDDRRIFALSALVLNAIATDRSHKDVLASVITADTTDGNKVVLLDGHSLSAKIARVEDEFEVTFDDKSYRVSTNWSRGEKIAHLLIDDVECVIKTDPITSGFRMRQGGMDINVQVLSPRVAELAALMPEKIPQDTSNLLLCPMPGLLVSLKVKEGDTVEEGQALAIVEAMKMENVLKAEKTSVIAKIPVNEGDSLAVDETIMEFEV
jgi:propionyl-CoA carboxylase alpha chain